jgi:hypothetical protein
MSRKPEYDPTRPKHEGIVSPLAFLGALFFDSWIATLLLGAVHSSVAAVPAFGYLATVALFYVGFLLVRFGSQVSNWKITARLKSLGQQVIRPDPLQAALDHYGRLVRAKKQTESQKQEASGARRGP